MIPRISRNAVKEGFDTLPAVALQKNKKQIENRTEK